MTVVIEYCYNSSCSYTRQISTRHKEQRYHEEAELVRQYLLHYCPEACGFVVREDFATTHTSTLPAKRLGAFEIDARICVDGEMLTYSLWSKLSSKLWPVWPDWQDALRQLLPVFELWIRPCAEHDDGTVEYVRGVTVSVLNFRGESLQVGHRASPSRAATRRHVPPRATTRRHAPPRAATRAVSVRKCASLCAGGSHHRDASRAAREADAWHVHGERHGHRQRRRGWQQVRLTRGDEARAGARASTDERQAARAQGAALRAAGCRSPRRNQARRPQDGRCRPRRCHDQGDRPAHRPGDLPRDGG